MASSAQLGGKSGEASSDDWEGPLGSEFPCIIHIECYGKKCKPLPSTCGKGVKFVDHTRHDPANYEKRAQKLEQQLDIYFGRAEVLKNDKKWLRRINRRPEPRLGSFEVLLFSGPLGQGPAAVVASKLLTRRWPKVQDVLKACTRFLENLVAAAGIHPAEDEEEEDPQPDPVPYIPPFLKDRPPAELTPFSDVQDKPWRYGAVNNSTAAHFKGIRMFQPSLAGGKASGKTFRQELWAYYHGLGGTLENYQLLQAGQLPEFPDGQVQAFQAIHAAEVAEAQEQAAADAAEELLVEEALDATAMPLANMQEPALADAPAPAPDAAPDAAAAPLPAAEPAVSAAAPQGSAGDEEAHLDAAADAGEPSTENAPAEATDSEETGAHEAPGPSDGQTLPDEHAVPASPTQAQGGGGAELEEEDDDYYDDEDELV